MIIIGAGMAGCLAGIMNKDAIILEAGPEKTNHQALLRFRSNKISEITGIPFKAVKVYKGIWHNDQSVPLTPRAIALYSRKVSDTISYRSITNLDTVKRYIAPDNFHELMIDQCRNRISFNNPVDKDIIDNQIKSNGKIISTMPISALSEMLDLPNVETDNHFDYIKVSKFRIPDCDIYMTFYYTDPTVGCYRASITGDILIIESMWDIGNGDIDIVMRSFGLSGLVPELMVVNHKQPMGKIIPIDEALRREFIFQATVRYGIYSLGRFALWKNILMDDVVHDIEQINKMINKDKYEHVKEGM